MPFQYNQERRYGARGNVERNTAVVITRRFNRAGRGGDQDIGARHLVSGRHRAVVGVGDGHGVQAEHQAGDILVVGREPVRARPAVCQRSGTAGYLFEGDGARGQAVLRHDGRVADGYGLRRGDVDGRRGSGTALCISHRSGVTAGSQVVDRESGLHVRPQDGERAAVSAGRRQRDGAVVIAETLDVRRGRIGSDGSGRAKNCNRVGDVGRAAEAVGHDGIVQAGYEVCRVESGRYYLSGNAVLAPRNSVRRCAGERRTAGDVYRGFAVIGAKAGDRCGGAGLGNSQSGCRAGYRVLECFGAHVGVRDGQGVRGGSQIGNIFSNSAIAPRKGMGRRAPAGVGQLDGTGTLTKAVDPVDDGQTRCKRRRCRLIHLNRRV